MGAPALMFSQLQDRPDLAPAAPGAGRALCQCGVTADASPDRCIQNRQTETLRDPTANNTEVP